MGLFPVEPEEKVSAPSPASWSSSRCRQMPLRVRDTPAPPPVPPSPSHAVTSVTSHFALCLVGRGELSLPPAWRPRPTLWLQKFIAKDTTETLTETWREDPTLKSRMLPVTCAPPVAHLLPLPAKDKPAAPRATHGKDGHLVTIEAPAILSDQALSFSWALRGCR